MALTGISSLSAQNTTQPNPKSFLLERYLIDPVNKTVSDYQYYEEEKWLEGERLHISGFKSVVDTLIDFNTTCLYVTDRQFVFKEYYNPALDTIPNLRRTHVDTKEYQYVHGFYEKDNQYFSLVNKDFRPLEVPEGVDIGRLIPVVEVGRVSYRYFYDDKSLYYHDNSGSKERFVKIASAENGKAYITPFFCVYDGVAYNNAERIGDISQLKAIDVHLDGRDMYFTDGNAIFDTHCVKRLEIPGFDKWVQLTAGAHARIENNCVYLAVMKNPIEPVTDNSGTRYAITLFASPDGGFFAIDRLMRYEPYTYDKVYIFNSDMGDYEELDTTEYALSMLSGYYVYRDKSYINGIPLENDFDMPNLRTFNRGWICDGKYLTHKDCQTWSGEGLRQKIVFNPCIPVADIDRLQFVHDELLVDGINFYHFDGRGIKVIPIEELGIKVEINLSNYAYKLLGKNILFESN